MPTHATRQPLRSLLPDRVDMGAVIDANLQWNRTTFSLWAPCGSIAGGNGQSSWTDGVAYGMHIPVRCPAHNKSLMRCSRGGTVPGRGPRPAPRAHTVSWHLVGYPLDPQSCIAVSSTISTCMFDALVPAVHTYAVLYMSVHDLVFEDWCADVITGPRGRHHLLIFGAVDGSLRMRTSCSGLSSKGLGFLTGRGTTPYRLHKLEWLSGRKRSVSHSLQLWSTTRCAVAPFRQRVNNPRSSGTTDATLGAPISLCLVA